MEYKIGDVFRLGDWPYADATVTHVDEGGAVTLHRPMCWASDVSRMPVLSFETITFSHSAMAAYRRIDNNRVR